MTEVKNGILQSLTSGLTLRDVFAAASLAGLSSNRDFGDQEEALLADYAYSQADAMLAARDASTAEAERQKRLAAIGEDTVQFAIDTNDCQMCNRDNAGDHDAECSVGNFLRDTKSAATEPAPPPSDVIGPNDTAHGDVGLAVSLDETERLVGARRNGDGHE